MNRYVVAHFDLFDGRLNHSLVTGGSIVEAVLLVMNNPDLSALYASGEIHDNLTLDELHDSYLSDETWVSVIEV